jgi:hypothetical protein
MESRIVENIGETFKELDERTNKQMELAGKNIKAVNILLEDKVGVNEVRDALKQVSDTQ